MISPVAAGWLVGWLFNCVVGWFLSIITQKLLSVIHQAVMEVESWPRIEPINLQCSDPDKVTAAMFPDLYPTFWGEYKRGLGGGMHSTGCHSSFTIELQHRSCSL